MSCFICCNSTGLGCQYCRDQIGYVPYIKCNHLDGVKICEKCQYESVRGMTEDELKNLYMSDIQKYCSKPYETEHDHMADAMTYSLSYTFDARKGYKSKWHPALIWKRIKGWFK